ncbi:MarR family winged helix-turn-helix transcriptional regulator [Sphingobacterium pedocola]|uniref:MarR family transcriptional regulator n=1 Tax=Sphingobacterium pedocola TaxID=2082722 RepID=A0ABR9T7T7_9SPHI|nr:MarR family transcriptional regulator [Sphingobacterium pedocola]MBE8721144.1 MarR family transcriptional regulator [Sphingobacterium pedocola]
MKYRLVKDVINLVERFENESIVDKDAPVGIEDFIAWVVENNTELPQKNPQWEGKENGRSPESALSTLLVQLNRYAKSYSKSAIAGSDFSTQEEFIYLINLRAFGGMSKMQLIQRNIHEKPYGIQIINRLLAQGWIEQADSLADKRSKIISITEAGNLALERQMAKIRQATSVVSGNLSTSEKMELIHLLNKLVDFHQPIYEQNLGTNQLLEVAYHNHLIDSN